MSSNTAHPNHNGSEGNSLEPLINEHRKYRKERYTAEYLGVSVATVRRWRLIGKGPRWYRIGASSVRYTIEDLDAYARQQPAGGVAA
jgi:predicted DNA-binding transcriptional regulator AlpA